jgi:hypothetical protein
VAVNGNTIISIQNFGEVELVGVNLTKAQLNTYVLFF